MWSLAKVVVFGVVAILVGVAAVSLPIGGKTPAEYVRGLLEAHLDDAGEARPEAASTGTKGAASQPAARPQPARTPGKVAPSQAADRPPADDPTDEDRAALEKLLHERIR